MYFYFKNFEDIENDCFEGIVKVLPKNEITTKNVEFVEIVKTFTNGFTGTYQIGTQVYLYKKFMQPLEEPIDILKQIL